MLANAREHVAQIGLGVQTVHARRLNQTIEDGGAASSSIGAGEEIVAAANGHGAQGSLRDEVVQFNPTIIEIARKRILEAERIANRRGGFGLLDHLVEHLFKPSSHVVEQRLGSRSANGTALLG